MGDDTSNIKEDILSRSQHPDYDVCFDEYLEVPLDPEKYPQCIELFEDIGELKPLDQGEVYGKLNEMLMTRKGIKCKNLITPITAQNVGFIPTYDLVMYSEPQRPDLTYCFTIYELKEMLKSGIRYNPETKVPFPREFLEFIENLPDSPPERTLIEVIDEDIQKRKIPEIPPEQLAREQKIRAIENSYVYRDPYVTVQQFLDLMPIDDPENSYLCYVPSAIRDDPEKIINFFYQNRGIVLGGLYSYPYVVMKVAMLLKEIRNPRTSPEIREGLEAQLRALENALTEGRGQDFVFEAFIQRLDSAIFDKNAEEIRREFNQIPVYESFGDIPYTDIILHASIESGDEQLVRYIVDQIADNADSKDAILYFTTGLLVASNKEYNMSLDTFKYILNALKYEVDNETEGDELFNIADVDDIDVIATNLAENKEHPEILEYMIKNEPGFVFQFEGGEPMEAAIQNQVNPDLILYMMEKNKISAFDMIGMTANILPELKFLLDDVKLDPPLTYDGLLGNFLNFETPEEWDYIIKDYGYEPDIEFLNDIAEYKPLHLFKLVEKEIPADITTLKAAIRENNKEVVEYLIQEKGIGPLEEGQIEEELEYDEESEEET